MNEKDLDINIAIEKENKKTTTKQKRIGDNERITYKQYIVMDYSNNLTYLLKKPLKKMFKIRVPKQKIFVVVRRGGSK